MKKTITLLLTLCLLLGLLPTEAVAFAGDIYRAGDVTQVKMADGSLSLQNGYVHVTLHKLLETYSYLTVAPTVKPDEDSMWNSQTPFCNYTTYNQGVPTTEGVVISLKKMEFVTGTPNGGGTKAIKAEYDLLSSHSHVAAKATVYYEIVQLKESGTAAKEDTWGVLTTVGSIEIIGGREQFTRDFDFRWGYYLNGFTSMGHSAMLEETGGPAIKISRTTVPEGEDPKITTESSTITVPVEKLNTKTVPKGYSSWGDVDGVYITEAYVDSYPWANPFVGLSDYYGKTITAPSGEPLRVDLAQFVSVQPGDKPLNSLVSCESYVSFDFEPENYAADSTHFLWGFRDLKTLKQEIPSEPDKVDPAIYAKRLAVFSSGSGVTVEHVADDAALSALKKRYGDPIALINGDYESKNGEDFTFTGGAALLSPSVTATWGAGGKLIIHKNGTVEQSGVSLSAPTFKFYQPTSGAEGALSISLAEKGFAFDIDPAKNDAIVYVDIPYATVKLENAAADVTGNLVFSGDIGFQTIFDGAEFSLEKLGYGLKGNEFKVNGVHAKGSFDTEKMLSLELAKIEGEVNTFKGEERYAFELELNAFDLFETEAKLALERANDGSLIPDELWFFVKSEPGILLIPPAPVGRLTGGGAGFKDLAATVNGNYFAIPPIKLRGAVSGAYLQLIEGRGDVVLGPSEISLKASDVGIVGFGKYGQVVDSFGYALKLTGQERKYKGTAYQGVYLVGSEELELHLPNTEFNVIVLDSSIELGAFGGVNKAKDRVYLGIGANGTVDGRVQIPKGFPFAGTKFGSAKIQLIAGGQTEIPIRNVSVSEGMKQAFNNIDAYLGAMAQTQNPVFGVRVWVLVPKVLQTKFRYKEGWAIEGSFIKKLPEWDWSSKGVEPVVQAISLEDGEEFAVMLAADSPDAEPRGSGNVLTITVNANADETPYIVLAFEDSATDEQIKALTVQKGGADVTVNWIANDGDIDPDAEINGTIIDGMKKTVDDGKNYRLAILRLSEDGEYSIDAGNLKFSDQKSFAVTPFEKLALTLDTSGNQVSGKVKYAEEDTKYVLRTYFAEKEGGADYLIDEQIDVNPNSISVDIPNSGTHAPSGEYYVTSFLMTEKTTTVADENGESENVTALMAIDSQALGTVSYTNSNEPAAPVWAKLDFVGNEVMRAEWEEVPNVDGYRVTVYQKKDGKWKDTGFGYDLKKSKDGQLDNSINMALTVGGNAVKASGENSAVSVPAENLEADKDYRIGVSAYREVPYFTESTGAGSTESTETGSMEGEETGAAEGTEGSTAGSGGTSAPKALTAKYYSKETKSAEDGVLLPKYKELTMTLNVNGTTVSADEDGVYHAYVGGKDDDILAVSCSTENVTYKVTRMDTTVEIVQETDGTYRIPTFEGSLMLKIDGMVKNSSATDVTSVFLLVSRDVTPPVLTLFDPVFFANRDTGEYTITGTADAGSEILYGENGRTQAAGDGSFAIHDKLEDERETNASLYLRAKDSAGNLSAQQLALITRQTRYAVTVNGSSYDAQNSGAGSYAAGSVVTVRAGSRGGYTFNGWTADSSVAFDDANAAETTFTMPDGSVTVTANWSRDGGSPSSGRDDSDPRYAVGIPDKTENGSVSVSPKNASQGDRVTVTVKPDAGYELDSLKVFDKNGKELELTDKGDGKFTFIMPAGKVEVKATFTEEVKTSPFRDVPTDAYYYEAVKWAQKKGITGGIGNDLFGPYQPCTRAQIVTFLWRAAGSPVVNYAMDLADVSGDAYYAEAVRWALSQGITTGTADGRFSPNAPCTRAQSVTFLFRASKASADGAPAFSDVAADAYYAEAVKWATDNGITNGTTSSTFSPGSGCTRAQIVTFLWRLYAEK